MFLWMTGALPCTIAFTPPATLVSQRQFGRFPPVKMPQNDFIGTPAAPLAFKLKHSVCHVQQQEAFNDISLLQPTRRR